MLCKDGLLGSRGYWEVDCEGWVVIGVACESAGRKAKDGPSGLGENDLSWGVGWAGSCYHVWHNGENIEFQAPLCPTIGIYADQPAGIIKFFLAEMERTAPRRSNWFIGLQPVSRRSSSLVSGWAGTPTAGSERRISRGCTHEEEGGLEGNRVRVM